MRIAVVHDYFTQMGGAEKVAEEMYCMLPSPDLFATIALRSCMPLRLANTNVHTSWMQNLPHLERYYRLYFLLYPFAVSALNLSDYDLVLSSSSGYAKGVTTGRDALHVCYCHTPMRWAWSFDSYAERESFSFSQRAALPLLIRGLKYWDRGASRQPDHFVANSKTVAERIHRAYGRSSEIIHPPIDIERFRPTKTIEDYYIVLSRLVPYKRVDLAVKACSRLKRKLLVIGDGPDRQNLEKLAGPTVKFMGRLPDGKVEYFVARCRALLFPGEEDFGMAPLEVAAAGKPTIAYQAGGALETILENQTGVFFREQTPEHLMQAIEQFEKLEWSAAILRRHSEQFSVDVFRERFNSFLKRIGAPIDRSHSVSSAIPGFNTLQAAHAS